LSLSIPQPLENYNAKKEGGICGENQETNTDNGFPSKETLIEISAKKQKDIHKGLAI